MARREICGLLYSDFKDVTGMSEASVKRLFVKMDDLSDRLARVETMLSEREKKQNGYTGLIAWIVTTCIAIYGAVIK